jgi:hypothetical protein
MNHVLNVLDVLHNTHNNWYYRIRDHIKLNNEFYNIDLMIDNGHRIVLSNTSTEDYVEVWCDTHDTHEDGFRVKKTALLEYLLYIIKEEYDI